MVRKAKATGRLRTVDHSPDPSRNGRDGVRGADPTATTLHALTAAILREEEAVRQGGGPAGHERQRKLGRLPVRERLGRLLDPGTPFLEIGLWAAWGTYGDVGGVPAAGVVTRVGRVEGRPCMVVA